MLQKKFTLYYKFSYVYEFHCQSLVCITMKILKLNNNIKTPTTNNLIVKYWFVPGMNKIV